MADMTLKALLLGEDRSMSKTFKGAEKSAEKSSKGIKGHFGDLKKGLAGDFTALGGSVAGGLSKIGPVGVAAGAAVGGLALGLGSAVKIGKESIDAFKNVAGETAKMKRIMGGTAEDASRLRFAFKETGVDADAGAKAIGILSKNLVAGNPAFKALGVNVKDATGHVRPFSALLPEIADKFKAMPDGAEKSAMALKLFGKGGLALLPFLNKGAEGLKELTDRSDKFGLTLSGKDLDALKASKLAHKDWDAAMEGAKVRIGAQLLPMVTKLVVYFQTKMIPIIVAAGKWVADHREQISKTAATIGRVLITMGKAWVAWEKVVFTVVGAIARVVIWLWNTVLQPTIHFILIGFANVASAVGHMLVALGHIPGFGWAKTAGKQMLGAAAAAKALADNIKKIPTNKTVTVNTYFKTHGANPLSTNGSGAGAKGYATGGRPPVGKLSIVGENGPEFFIPDGPGTIYTKAQAAALAGSGRGVGGGGGVAYLDVTVRSEDGRVIQKKLLSLKSSTGMNLGLA